MKTTGAKELRTNFNQIFDQVANGEEILVTHLLKKHLIRYVAVYPKKSNTSGTRHAGLHTFDAAVKKPNPCDPNLSLKK